MRRSSTLGLSGYNDLVSTTGESLRAYLEYLNDLGVHDLYRMYLPADATAAAELAALLRVPKSQSVAAPNRTLATASEEVSPHVRSATPVVASRTRSGPKIIITETPRGIAGLPGRGSAEHQATSSSIDASFSATPTMPAVSFNQLAPLPSISLEPSQKVPALAALRTEIGDCTRCPLAYAGRHSIVFADGDPGASLMFVGEGPGADEDASGLPFVGKAGQLLNNMIAAMGLKREQVYIANIVMCRPPKNRTPEPVEANTCSHFLLRQIDIVRPKVIVALGSTAATYLLGAKQSLASLRGQWHDVRGARCAVTYHPAYLLRDPKMKGEAWKDLQRVMAELSLKSPAHT